jgi:hypothetical protein
LMLGIQVSHPYRTTGKNDSFVHSNFYVRKELLHSILIEFGTHMQLLGLIKMCLN